MLNRENRHLHTLESNSYMYCPHTFLLVRTYKWLCTNLETVSSLELKLLTSTLLSYAKTVDAANKEILSQVIQALQVKPIMERSITQA